jgi:uncharacterized coiled-coil DUF342 family protein
MDLQAVINLGIGLGFTAIGWWAKTIWNAVQELKSDLAKLREEIPKLYIPKNEFREGITELKSMLINISDKLDHKVDKQ